MQSRTAKKQQKNGKKKKKSTSSNSGQTASLKQLVHLSPQAEGYARLLADPSTGPLCGIPSAPAQYTRKSRVWVKGILSTNTNGFGYLVVDPSRLAANDAEAVIYSLATGTTTNIAWTIPAGGLDAAAATSNSDYATADFGPSPTQIQYRIVAASAKVRYIGTELNRGGQVIGFHDPDHQSLVTRTVAALDGEDESKRFAVNRTWKTVLYRPVDTDDLDFQEEFAYEDPVSPQPADLSYFMGFIVTGNAMNPSDFEYEVYADFEFIGLNVRSKTDSGFDPVGYGAVHAVSNLGKNLFPTETPENHRQGAMVRDTAMYIAKHTSSVTHHNGSLDNAVHATQIASNVATTANALTNGAIGDIIVGGLSALFGW
jgi:hypothetical protein